jgi:hypothetical protein
MKTSTDLEPIAIVGLSCRFPGAENPDAFLRLLRDNLDAIYHPERDDRVDRCAAARHGLVETRRESCRRVGGGYTPLAASGLREIIRRHGDERLTDRRVAVRFDHGEDVRYSRTGMDVGHVEEAPLKSRSSTRTVRVRSMAR